MCVCVRVCHISLIYGHEKTIRIVLEILLGMKKKTKEKKLFKTVNLFKVRDVLIWTKFRCKARNCTNALGTQIRHTHLTHTHTHHFLLTPKAQNERVHKICHFETPFVYFLRFCTHNTTTYPHIIRSYHTCVRGCGLQQMGCKKMTWWCVLWVEFLLLCTFFFVKCSSLQLSLLRAYRKYRYQYLYTKFICFFLHHSQCFIVQKGFLT